MQFNLQDQMLKAYIDKIFDRYDTDKSGTLDEDQLTFFFNDLFKQLGIQTTVTKQQSLQAIRSIDQNSDGGVDKKQLFDAFRQMMNRPRGNPQVPQYNQDQMTVSYPPPPPPTYNYPPQNPYQPVYHNPYQVQNPYMNQPLPQYSQYPNYNQGPYNYQPPPQQYNNYPNPYMNNTYMGGSTGNRWGRMQ